MASKTFDDRRSPDSEAEMNTTEILVPAASLEIGQQKIAISGASGLVGSALAEKLRMTHQVINVTRHSS